MWSEYMPMEIVAEILKRLPLKPLLQFRTVSKPWKRLIDSPCFRSFVTGFIRPPMIVSYMCDRHIPVEILAEILKRLPLKPLIQFRCVSKPWKILIDNPYFIAFYGVRHPQPRRLMLRIDDRNVINEHKYYSFVDEDRFYEDYSFIDHWKTTSISAPVLLTDYKAYPCGVGSSHGLVCFQKISTYIYYKDCYDSEMVVLWNLSIRKYVCIPVPDSLNYNFGNYGDDDAVGFEVCPVTLDPTILKIKRKSKTEDVHGIKLPWKVGVFTLSTRTWNILSTNLPRESITLRGSQVVIDRFIYWVAFDLLGSEDGRSQSPFLIVSFDLIAKEFKEINLTDSLTNPLCSIQSISKLEESLLLLEYHREFEEGEPVCCLWMMKDQGVSRSFTKLYNINMPHATVSKLLGFTKFGDLLLTTQQEEDVYFAKLEMYDPDFGDVYDLDNYGNDNSFFMWSYMESLLLFDHLDGFIYSISN